MYPLCRILQWYLWWYNLLIPSFLFSQLQRNLYKWTEGLIVEKIYQVIFFWWEKFHFLASIGPRSCMNENNCFQPSGRKTVLKDLHKIWVEFVVSLLFSERFFLCRYFSLKACILICSVSWVCPTSFKSIVLVFMTIVLRHE